MYGVCMGEPNFVCLECVTGACVCESEWSMVYVRVCGYKLTKTSRVSFMVER